MKGDQWILAKESVRRRDIKKWLTKYIKIIDQTSDSLRELVHIYHICLLLHITPSDFKDTLFSSNDNIDRLIEHSINVMVLPAGFILVFGVYMSFFQGILVNIGRLELLLAISTATGSYFLGLISLRSTIYDIFLIYGDIDVTHELNMAVSLIYKIWGTVFTLLSGFLLLIALLSLTPPTLPIVDFPSIDITNQLFTPPVLIFVFLVCWFFIGLIPVILAFISSFLVALSFLIFLWGLFTGWYYLTSPVSLLLLLFALYILIKHINPNDLILIE